MILCGSTPTITLLSCYLKLADSRHDGLVEFSLRRRSRIFGYRNAVSVDRAPVFGLGEIAEKRFTKPRDIKPHEEKYKVLGTYIKSRKLSINYFLYTTTTWQYYSFVPLFLKGLVVFFNDIEYRIPKNLSIITQEFRINHRFYENVFNNCKIQSKYKYVTRNQLPDRVRNGRKTNCCFAENAEISEEGRMRKG